AVAGHDADLVIETYGIKKGGKFTSIEGDVHGSVLHLAHQPATADAQRRREAARKKLFAAREQRVHPPKDDKILTDWNGLMIAALAEAAQAFDRPDYDAAARRTADFLLARMRTKDGRLLHRFRDGD